MVVSAFSSTHHKTILFHVYTTPPDIAGHSKEVSTLIKKLVDLFTIVVRITHKVHNVVGKNSTNIPQELGSRYGVFRKVGKDMVNIGAVDISKDFYGS
jgi:hypothetical protein